MLVLPAKSCQQSLASTGLASTGLGGAGVPGSNGENGTMSIDRRQLMTIGAGLAGGAFLGFEARAAAKPVVNLQLGWIVSGNQVGEVCAKAQGFYADEGIDLAFQPGGPNIDGVAVVASGRYE